MVFEGQFALKGKVITHCQCAIRSITLDKVGSSDKKVDYWLPSHVPLSLDEERLQPTSKL